MNRQRFGDYLSGLTDGEGHFAAFVYVDRDKRKRAPIEKTRLSFQLTLRADDLPVLCMVRDYFGCGRFNDKRQYGKHHNPQVTFCVTRIRDLAETVVPHFDAHPMHAKKAGDFVIWRQAVKLAFAVHKRPSGHKWRPEEWAAFRLLCDQLKENRRYRVPSLSVEEEAVGEALSV